MNSRPFYSCKPILSVGALSLALGMEKEFLVEVAQNANERYRLAKPITKPDGSIRQPFDALEPLKEVHRRIKDQLFAKVIFPYYLTGSLKGKDYRVNAELHASASIIICEDVEGFFPATSSDVVFDIWRSFFGFSEDVASLLTTLTTKNCALPQGAISSSFLANLAFWRHEPILHDNLMALGIQYSRYVDDIAVSSKHFLDSSEQSAAIAKIYGMLAKQGYRAKRRKHEVFTSGRKMLTTKLIVNKRPALSSKERAQIRTAVFQLELRVKEGERSVELMAEMARVCGRVGKLKGLHLSKGSSLLERVRKIRESLKVPPDIY